MRSPVFLTLPMSLDRAAFKMLLTCAAVASVEIGSEFETTKKLPLAGSPVTDN